VAISGDNGGSRAETLRERRVRLGLTQRAVAVGADVSVQSVMLLDRGYEPIRSAVRERINDFFDKYERDGLPLAAAPSTDVELAGLLRSLGPEKLAIFARTASRLSRDDRLGDDDARMATLLAGVAVRLGRGGDPLEALHDLAPTDFYDCDAPESGMGAQAGDPGPSDEVGPIALDRAAAAHRLPGGGGHDRPSEPKP
jgi:transcriptional regulator with XRE-family HTH domain